jgi:hypothetical protein
MAGIRYEARDRASKQSEVKVFFPQKEITTIQAALILLGELDYSLNDEGLQNLENAIRLSSEPTVQLINKINGYELNVKLIPQVGAEEGNGLTISSQVREMMDSGKTAGGFDVVTVYQASSKEKSKAA